MPSFGPFAVSDDCAASWVEFSGSCYYMSNDEYQTEMTWMEARAWCMREGADLVSVGSTAENDFLKGLVITFLVIFPYVDV